MALDQAGSGNRMRRLAIAMMMLVALALITAEVVARALGAGDFPVTKASDSVGYIFVPNQHGAFMNKNHWAYNERSMGVQRPFKPTSNGILLIGDSLVNGGNPTDQPDRVGPQLEGVTHCPVWPISAGSWALLNELNEIKANPDFMKLGTIVFVSNTDDFGRASTWQSEYTHPRSHPWLVSFYILQRLYWPVNDNVPSKMTSTSADDWRRALAQFLATYRGRVVFILYPNRGERAAGKAAFPSELVNLQTTASMPAQSFPLIVDPRWKDGLYRDVIHPNPAGNRVIAKIIAEKVPRCD